MSLEWDVTTIGELCSNVSSGGTPKSTNEEYYGGNIPWLNTKEINFNRIYDTEKHITNEGFKNSAAKWVKKDSVIVAMYGATAAKVAMNMVDLTTNQACCNLTIDKSLANPKFVYYYLYSNYERLLNLASGAAQQNLNSNIIKEFPINIPSLNVQNEIVNLLSTIDDKIELNQKVNKNLLSIADAIYKKEFQNFDTYSEDELIASDFGLIPKNWHYKTLDEISDVGIGKTPPRKETWWFSEQEGVKWVSIKDLGNSGTYIFETSEYLTNEAIEKFNVKLIPINTVILSFKLTVGRIGITTEEMVTNEAIAHFKLSENSVITKEYLYLYLKNFNYEELGSTSSIAKAINSKIVKKIPILIPNNKINEFKDLFENLFNKIKSNQLEINKLTKLRDTLLPKLMSGEIDVSKINCDLIIVTFYFYFEILFN